MPIQKRSLKNATFFEELLHAQFQRVTLSGVIVTRTSEVRANTTTYDTIFETTTLEWPQVVRHLKTSL
jgi:hypothetical protein